MKKLSVMLLALAGLFIFTGCDSSKKTIEKWGESVADFAGFREDPKHIAGKWMTAILDGDVKKANKHSTEETHIANGLLIGMVNGEHKYTKVIRATFETWIESLKNAKEEIIDDDAAKVIVEGEQGIPIFLKKVRNKWKVDGKKMEEAWKKFDIHQKNDTDQQKKGVPQKKINSRKKITNKRK